MSFFDATAAFDRALTEIDVLVAQAERLKSRPDEYATYVKAAVVLLAAKLEAFIENVIEEYAVAVGAIPVKAKHLPTAVRVHSTNHLLRPLANSQFQAKADLVAALLAASRLWSDEAEMTRFPVNTKFNYGKHGSSEVRGIFERIGIANICEECKVSSAQDDTLLLANPDKSSISPEIDSLTNIRNNIVHSDANPASVTHQQVARYRERLWEFVYLVDLRLYRAVGELERAVAEHP